MGPKPDQSLGRVAHILAWVLAFIGAGICLLVAGGFGLQQLDNLWPLPGLYLLEISLLGLAVVASLFLRDRSAAWHVVPWLAGGILLAFVILGGFSIGPFLFPAMFAFWVVGVLADLRTPRKIAIHLALAVLVALLQGSLIFLLIGLAH